MLSLATNLAWFGILLRYEKHLRVSDPKYSFTDNIFYGREFSLMVFDVLLFTIIDFNEFNYLLAAIVTYVVGKVIVLLIRVKRFKTFH